MVEIAKNMIAKNFNGYIVFIVGMNFRKHFSTAKIFPSRFPGIFANIFNTFKHKIIPVYSNKRVRDLVTCPVRRIKYSKIFRSEYFNNKSVTKW